MIGGTEVQGGSAAAIYLHEKQLVSDSWEKSDGGSEASNLDNEVRLIQVMRGAFGEKDVKNEGTSGDVYENT
jgi:hypothetical protein